MKKYILLLVIIFGKLTDSIGQTSAYYDALLIRASCISIPDGVVFYNREKLVVLLKSYFPDLIITDSQIKANPFFYHFVPVGGIQSLDFIGSVMPNIQPKNKVSSIGGLDVTNIADGLAKFIVKRTKQELNLAFFEKFKKALSNPKFRDLQSVFPQTHRALTVLGDEIYNYDAYLMTLREAFNNDLAGLSSTLPGIIENHPEFFNQYPDLADVIRSGCYVSEAISRKVHPGDIIKDYPEAYLEGLKPNMKAAIQSVQLLSASLKDTAQSADSSYWVSQNKIWALAKDTIAFKIYLGLLYQQMKNEQVVFQHLETGVIKHDTLAQIFGRLQDYGKYMNYIKGFSERSEKVNRFIQQYRKLPFDSVAVEQYVLYFDASIDLLEYASSISDIAPKEWKKDPTKRFFTNLKDTLSVYFDVAKSFSHLTLNVNRKQYPSAVMNAVNILSLVFEKSQPVEDTKEVSKREYNDAVKQIRKSGGDALLESVENNSTVAFTVSDKDTKKAIAVYHQWKLVEESAANSKMLKSILRYGTFMATVASAKNSDEVQDAIETFALPPGSSRIKRVSPFNVALNAYAGLYYGYEQIDGVDAQFRRFNQFNSYGVTVPIGVSISRGHSIFFFGTGKKNWGWSSSIFISLVDIGAVAAFRLKDDTTAQVPTIQLKHIFSPGAFFSLGIPKTPLSLNFGAQMGPNLRKIESATATNLSDEGENKTYWRYSASIVVDIPVLNFYTKSR